MSFEKAGDIIREAHKNKYGVAAFNIFNFESIKFAIDAAEQAGKPVLVQFYPGFHGYMDFDVTFDIAKSLGNKAKVPVALHLDRRFLSARILHLECGF